MVASFCRLRLLVALLFRVTWNMAVHSEMLVFQTFCDICRAARLVAAAVVVAVVVVDVVLVAVVS